MYSRHFSGLFFLLAALFASSGVLAQQVAPAPAQATTPPQITEQKLVQFVEASQEINKIQQGMQEEMVQAIEGEGLDIDKFNTMASQQRDPSAAPDADISDADKAAFESAMQKVQTMQMAMQQEMEQAIQSKNLQMNEYQEIMQAYQQSPELQQQVNEMMQQGE